MSVEAGVRSAARRIEGSKSVGERGTRVRGWKLLSGRDNIGLEASVEARDVSAWAAPQEMRHMQ
jgi:hypothetical protein